MPRATAAFLLPGSALGPRTARAARVRRKPLACATRPGRAEQRAEQRAERPKRPKRPKRAATPPSGGAGEGADGLGTAGESAAGRGALVTAMGDYFGDDGREVGEYLRRPRTADGRGMFRVVVVGSGAREGLLLRALRGSGAVRGLYYCPDEGRVCDLEMEQVGVSATVSAYARQEDMVRFAKWIVADAVFVGPDRGDCVGRESEAALAAAGITVFGAEVGRAIVEGDLGVDECLQPLDEGDAGGPAEALVE